MSRLLLLSLSTFLLACGGSSSPTAAPEPTGLDDVTQACAVRAAWTDAGSSTCLQCTALAALPKCSCETEPYAGSCSDLENAMTDEPTCAGVSECRNACDAGDCGCVDGCYTGKAACRAAASAADGCLVAVCSAYCN